MDRVQMIKDRVNVRKFIYEMGKQVSNKILNESMSDEEYIDLCKWVVDECSKYPKNEYGVPTIKDVMSDAYRRVNYALADIDAHSGF